MGETLPIAPGESSMTFGQGVGGDGLTTRSYLQDKRLKILKKIF
jgi:hypothetical protein